MDVEGLVKRSGALDAAGGVSLSVVAGEGLTFPGPEDARRVVDGTLRVRAPA
jgi:hypothetical protein